MLKNFKTLSLSIGLFCALLILSYMSYFLVIRDWLRPPLLKGMPSNKPVAEAEFRTRLQNSFPAQTTNEHITQELTAQGFEIRQGDDQKFYALYQEFAGVCELFWHISWELDEQAQVKNLYAIYGGGCP